MAYVESTGVIFDDKKYAEKCWTHDLKDLLVLANLKTTMDVDKTANLALSDNWDVATAWQETSRYEQKTQVQAQTLYDAIATVPDGVLPWLRIRW